MESNIHITKPLLTLTTACSSSSGSLPKKSAIITNTNTNTTNGVSSLTFLYRNRYDSVSQGGFESDESNNDEEEDDLIPSFRCRSLALNTPTLICDLHSHSHSHSNKLISNRNSNNKLSNDSNAIDQATRISFARNQTYLASCHINGEAHVWDLNKRQIAFSLTENRGSHGPGLTILQKSSSNNSSPPTSTSTSTSTSHTTCSTASPSTLLYQTRDEKGTVSIHNLSPSMDGCRISNTIHTYSRTFCQMTCGLGTNTQHPYLLVTPSKHESIVSLWDIRSSSNNNKPVGIVHGAGINLKSNNSNTDWRKDGMVMSLKLCNWGDDHHCGCSSSNNFALGCGMESGNLYIHDIRKLNNHHDGAILNIKPMHDDNDDDDDDNASNGYGKESFEFESTHYKSIQLGMNPILTLDMLPSSSKSSSQNSMSSSSSSSLITIAGTAGDSNDQLDLPENQRGTVNIIKVSKLLLSSSSSATIKNQINARIRAKIGTCKIDDKRSFMGKPGVSICRLNPNHTKSSSSSNIHSSSAVFAVGGWDKRVRIYSRTSGKLLHILRGSNDESISALDWVKGSSSDGSDGSFDVDGDTDLMKCGLLAAGSCDGKIMIWRTTK